MRRLSIAVMVVFAWLVVALAFDRLLLAPYCQGCASAAALELKVTVPAGVIDYPPVSLLVLFLVPMVALAFSVVPWRDLRSRQAWTHAIESWWEPWFWIAIALLIAIAAESVYLVAREYLPKPVIDVAQRFSVAGLVSLHLPGYDRATPLAITASLMGLTGLAIGAYLFFQNGLNAVMRWFKA